MTDSPNDKRPVRKLTVKNFSVIKDAELEFGKITVLIGPQASGKSLLCKLAYFFQNVVVEQAESAIRSGGDLHTFSRLVLDEFGSWFPPFGLEAGTEIEYRDGLYGVRIGRNHSPGSYDPVLGRVGAGGGSYGVEFSEAVKDRFNRIQHNLEIAKASSGDVDFKGYAQEIKDEFKNLQTGGSDVYSYIPSTRSFFVTAQRALLGINPRVDPLTLRFSQDFSFDFQNRVPKTGLSHELTNWIDGDVKKLLNGEVILDGKIEMFRSNDGRRVPISYLSSGTQELLPLATCLREFVALSGAIDYTLGLRQALHRRLFFVEEPEMNVFPSTQYDLVRIFARMTNEPALDASWVITTHSPYILSAFDNLIKAGVVGNSSKEHHEAVSKIVDEKYWVRPEDFRAYKIADGKLESIYKEETGDLDADYLDNVSGKIAEEFTNLLEIQYGG